MSGEMRKWQAEVSVQTPAAEIPLGTLDVLATSELKARIKLKEKALRITRTKVPGQVKFKKVRLSAPEKKWDIEWSPLDVSGLLYVPQLLAPFSFRTGGICLDCGSHHVSGLNILVRPQVDVFSPEVRHYDRVAVFAVMACASWHTYLLSTDYPEELKRWAFGAIRNHGDRSYAKSDVGDALSDRWNRFIPDAVHYPAAATAFHEAAQSRLEHHLKWPLPNVRMYIPGEEAGGLIAGHKLWLPTIEDRNVSGVLEIE